MPNREEWTRLQRGLVDNGFLADAHVRDVSETDAKSYMLRRLKKKKPPFGPCMMVDGGEYSVPVRFLSRDYPPRCLAWSYSWREGKQCVSSTQGRTDRIISISIPPDEHRQEPFIGEFVWYSTPYRDNSE